MTDIEEKVSAIQYILTPEQLKTFEKHQHYGNLLDTVGTLERKLDIAVKALDKLARLGNGAHYGNSDGNIIAQEVLAQIKERKEQPMTDKFDWEQKFEDLSRYTPKYLSENTSTDFWERLYQAFRARMMEEQQRNLPPAMTHADEALQSLEDRKTAECAGTDSASVEQASSAKSYEEFEKWYNAVNGCNAFDI
jgi:hypothetical protein